MCSKGVLILATVRVLTLLILVVNLRSYGQPITWTLVHRSSEEVAVAFADGDFVLWQRQSGRDTLPQLFSSDGNTWEAIQRFPSLNAEEYHFTGSEWLANNHLGLHHLNAEGWEEATLGFRIFDLDSDHGASVVVVGGNGNIGHSHDDGSTWALSLSPASTPLEAVVFGNGQWLAFVQSSDGNGGSFPMLSPDGRGWTRLAEIKMNGVRDLAYGNGLFVALGRLTVRKGNAQFLYHNGPPLVY